MTNQIDDNAKARRGKHMTPEQREQDCWRAMAQHSSALASARSASERAACLEAILEKFRDVPDRQPSEQDTAAYARFATKTLLTALIRAEGKQAAVFSVANENVFNEWIDEWLPQHHAA